MLDAIKKVFSNTTKGTAEMQKEDKALPVLASVNVDQAAQLTELQASFATQGEQLAAALASLSGAQALLEEVAAAKAALVAEAHSKRMALRKEKIEASVGTGKAEALLVATEALEDAQFEAVVGAMAASFDVEAASPMFKEVGVTAEADTSKVVEKTALEAALEKKYHSKKA